jgi:hypothetical protein|tara:strand:+ start:3989 stop:4216 length:228 start_codon:yes stop_codon:yes gene_type:complete
MESKELEKKIIELEMVIKNEVLINKEFKIENAKIKLEVNSLMKINQDYAQKIAQLELLIDQMHRDYYSKYVDKKN